MLKTLLNSIWNFVYKLWKSADTELKKLLPIIINVVNSIKTINESTAGDIIAMIINAAIPGKPTDTLITSIRAKLKEILPKIITDLNIAESIANITDTNEQLKAILAAINLSNEQTQNMYYHGISVLILDSLSDGKLTWSEAVQISQYTTIIFTRNEYKDNSQRRQ